MSAVATLAGAVPGPAIDWHSIDWKQVYRTVRRFQARIVKAVRAGRWGQNHAYRRRFRFLGPDRPTLPERQGSAEAVKAERADVPVQDPGND